MTNGPAHDGPPRPGKLTGSSPSERDRRINEGSEPSLPGGGTYFLGRYRIVDEIGVGGMASVHLARADGPGGFQKWVAIKRIHRHLAEDETFIRMFLDEARIAARISHPNVAQVFDLGKHRDTYWIAMEYLHGEPLREIMRMVEEGNGLPMGAELAAKIVADSAEGLHAAHELRDKNGKLLNLVHRDVTPHNLFLTYDGAVKVVDFGIAKVTGRLSNTRAGTLKGKLAYMSPEQVRGAQVDRRTDIFALGVVLWELTTGKRLFRQDSDLETLERVQACVVPPPSSIVDAYPGELETIVMRALSKDLNRRFATSREMARALQQYLMRAESFVGSDEIGAYVKKVLAERFEKREAHLQWAAEVTQTISLDQLQGGAVDLEDVSILTYASDVQEVPGPRPAAGAPAPRSSATAATRPPPRSGGTPPPRSATPPPPSATPPPLSDARPVARGAPPPPRPAAGAPARGDPRTAPLPSYDLNTTTATTSSDLLEVIEDDGPDRPQAPNPAARSAAQARTAPKPTMLGLGPVPSPKVEPLPSFGSSGDTHEPQAAPAMHDYSEEDDDAVTRVIHSPLEEAESHAVSAVHAPAKKVQPAPLPPQAVVVSPAAMTPEPPQYGNPNPYGQQAPYGNPYGAQQQSMPPGMQSMPPQSMPPGYPMQGMPMPGYQQPEKRDSSRVLITLIAAVTTLIALAMIALVVLKITDRGPAAAPGASATPATTGAAPTETAASPSTAPAPATGDTRAEPTPKTKDDGPVDLSTLPKEKPAPKEPSSPKPATAVAAAPKPAAPKAEPGYLTVVCDPYCDSVVAGGRSLGPSPVVRAALPPGNHSVILRGSGKTTSIGVTIVSGQTTARRVKMGS